MAENITANISKGTILDVWAGHGVSVLVGVAMVIGIPTNILVVLVHIKIVGKTVTDWMIFYLAVCDIMTLLTGPMYILQSRGYIGYVNSFSSVICKLHVSGYNSVSMASFMFCACTALERYFKVVLSKEMLTNNQARFIWIPIVLVSFGFGSVIFPAMKAGNNGQCTHDKTVLYLITIENILITVVTVTSSIIMAICYIGIGIFLLRKMKEINQSGNSESFIKSYKNTLQTTKMLAIVTIVFFISSNVPFGLKITIGLYFPSKSMRSIIYFFINIAFINTFFNPILYMIMSATFRQRSSEIVRFCCKCVRRSNQTPSSQSHSNFTDITPA